MRDDPEYWDALSERLVATVRERRQRSWLRAGIWAPPVAIAAALMLLLASGRKAATAEPPSIAAMLAAQAPAPSIATMLTRQP